MPLKIIKDIGIHAPHFLVNHFNIFCRTGLTPELKTSRILPPHKKDERSALSNYRPISNLWSIGKLFEKIILEKLMEETRNLEGVFQHAYCPHHSTTTALLKFQDLISKDLDNKRTVAVYSMDLSAAFDLLRPNTILENLLKHNVSHG